jgi:hypothetical protein
MDLPVTFKQIFAQNLEKDLSKYEFITMGLEELCLRGHLFKRTLVCIHIPQDFGTHQGRTIL